jgi:hypothetical protein
LRVYVEGTKNADRLFQKQKNADRRLGLKVDREVVAPHFPRLLETLIMCFKDESWSVTRRCRLTIYPPFSLPRLACFGLVLATSVVSLSMRKFL